MTDPHPLTRRQKLLAARSVQLGNIAEALVDRFDFNQQVFDLDGEVMEAEARVSVFDKRIEALRERITDFRDRLDKDEHPPITVSTIKPRNPKPDHIWIDTGYLQMFVYLDQWVEIG